MVLPFHAGLNVFGNTIIILLQKCDEVHIIIVWCASSDLEGMW